jgi:putative copper export protein
MNTAEKERRTRLRLCRMRVLILAVVVSSLSLLAGMPLFFAPVVSPRTSVMEAHPFVETVLAQGRTSSDTDLTMLRSAPDFHNEQEHMNAIETISNDGGVAPSWKGEVSLVPSRAAPAQGSLEGKGTTMADSSESTIAGISGFNAGVSSRGLSGPGTLRPQVNDDVQESHQRDLFGRFVGAANWLMLIVLTLWGGGLVIERLIVHGGKTSSPFVTSASARLRSLQEQCLWLLLIGELVTFVLQAIQSMYMVSGPHQSVAQLLQIGSTTASGQAWLLRVVFTACALLLQHRRQQVQRRNKTAGSATQTAASFRSIHSSHARHHPRWKRAFLRVKRGVAALATLALAHVPLLLLVLLGAITLTSAAPIDFASFPSLRLSAIVMDWLMLVARCIWFGGFACLGTVLLPDMESEWDDDLMALMETLRCATPLLGGAIGVTLWGTLFFSEARLRGATGGADFLASDPSGYVLLIELVGLALLVMVSFYALLVPRLKIRRGANPVEDPLDAQIVREQAERTIRRSTRLFLLIAAGVLLCSTLMNFLAPPPLLPGMAEATKARPVLTFVQAGQRGHPPRTGEKRRETMEPFPHF